MNTSVTAQLGSNLAHGEPVAWRWRDGPEETWTVSNGKPHDEWFQVEALYASPISSGQKIADIEILQQKLEFAEWEWNRATEGMKERDAKIALLESRVEELRTECQAWRSDLVRLRDIAIDQKDEVLDAACIAVLLNRPLYPHPSTNSTADAGSGATSPQERT